MKANRRSGDRRFASDQDGVSVVIGAIMIIGLFVATLVTIRAQYVPVWEENKEAVATEELTRQIAEMVASIQSETTRPSGTALARPITLGRAGTSVWASGSHPGHIEFTSSTAATQINANRLQIIVQNSTSIAGVSEEWTAISGTNVPNITRIDSLRMRIATADSGYAGDTVTITVTDASGAFGGDFQALIQNPSGNDWNVNVRTRDSASNLLFNQPAIAFPNNAAQTPLWIDTMDPELRFNQVLAAASKPMRLTLAETSSSAPHVAADFAAAFLQRTATGGDIVVGGGVTEYNYRQTLGNGRLTLRTQNQYLTDRQFVVEHGALIVNQSEGAAFKIPPAFNVAVAGGTTLLSITHPSIVGDSTSASGTGTATVYLNGTAGTSFQAQAPRFSYNVTTLYPSLWTNYWTRQLNEAGLSSVSGEFTVTTTATQAQLTVYGLTTSPTSTVYDMNVRFTQANVGIEVKG